MSNNNVVSNQTDKLKNKVIKRTVLLIFGSIAACALSVALPTLYLTPLRQVTYGANAAPPAQAFPIGALIPLVIMVVILAALAYALYDVIRLFVQYRKSKEMDSVMFP